MLSEACGSQERVSSGEASACQLLADSEHYQDIDYTAVDNQGRHMGFHILYNWREEIAARFSKEFQSVFCQKDNRGFSCLGHALKRHGLKTSLQMIEDGGDLWEEDPNGDFALHHLCRFESMVPQLARYEPIMTKFLSKGSINVRNRLGETPLHIYLTTSRGSRDLDGLPFLISNEADVLAKDNRGETMLHRIANRKSSLPHYPGGTDPDGQYNLKLFQQFVGYGCDPLQEDNEGITALDVAAAAQNQKILEAYQRKSGELA